MQTTLISQSRPRPARSARLQRLGFLERIAEELANAWFAGYAVHLATWPDMAERCLRMHVHFRRRQAQLCDCRLRTLRR